MLIVGVDLLEIALQIGDAVEIGIDALDRGVLLLADQGRRRRCCFHRGIPAGPLIAAALIELARLGLRGIVGWFGLRGCDGRRRLLHRRALLGERRARREAESGWQAQEKPSGCYAH